jgi:hypothetical protein
MVFEAGAPRMSRIAYLDQATSVVGVYWLWLGGFGHGRVRDRG